MHATGELFQFKDLKFYTAIRSHLKVLQNAQSEHRYLSDTTSRHPFKKPINASADSPSPSFNGNHGRKNRYNKLSPGAHHLHHPKNRWHSISPAPTPSSTVPELPLRSPAPEPKISPSNFVPKKLTRAPHPSQVMTLPPPPPNQDCSSLSCTEPLTYGPSGSPCGCVWPIQVSLRLSVTLYTFFPLVSELAEELSTSLSLNRSQVRIMGANAANQQLEKTVVLLNLVPLDDQFDATTANSIYRKFWKRQVHIKTSLFGMYQVVYVRYPGLPPSPPALTASQTATINSKPYQGGINNDGNMIKPIGVNVPRRKRNGLGPSMVIVIVLSSITTAVVSIGFIWLLLFKFACCIHKPDEQHSPALISARGQPSGGARSLTLESHPSSASVSLSSSILPYTGTAKIFSITDIERATENFDSSRIIGEGGFGVVYSGILDDGRKVAVKILKRDDRQGSREFLAEVEMLNRLHHRNLVKLLGLCNEPHCRCLVYELVPNGSVESHLHGADKEVAPLDWCARVKIALGAARGLSYLHEDSSPRVIHRDFKSSNILLEYDFTPKVSDFGLARAALDEQNKHISTHVMGTFGYLAPEYAMTGHLLVKSDVYSYGVVLLELLTGRKPVDLSQPPGQENLVAWARPLLTTNEGLETIIDPAIKSNITFDSVVKFAAIASMCVQPEVSHRPFMGEVVQALKLVCNEFEETKDLMSGSYSHDEFSISKNSQIWVDDQDHDYDVGEVSTASYTMHHQGFDDKIRLSTSNLPPEAYGGLESDSFRRQFNSAPLKRGRKKHFWERLRGFSRGSMSERGFTLM
ncbi:OLC1v1015032C1 [Oldenlandia corymbosa var. corymbosa]|nr:OLC1v1015032C1 [Oldenlandia corymbosa var. corymbosa]